MPLQQILSLLTSFVILFVGLIILLWNPKRKVNQVFSSLTFCVLFWIICNYILDFTDVYKFSDPLLLWARLSIVGPIFIPFLLIYFSYFFPREVKKIPKFVWYLLSLPTLILLSLVPTNLNIKEVIPSNIHTAVKVIPGPLYTVFLIYFLIYLGLGTFMVYKKYRVVGKLEKSQIALLFTGIIITGVLALLTNVVLLRSLGGEIQPASIGPLFSIIFISFTAYAIVKAQLFDIRVIATETLVVLIGLGLVIDALLSKTFPEGFLKAILFLLVSYGGYRLVLSVKEEIQRRQQIQELTEQLQKANIRLQELDKLKSEFLSVASHELNSPMSIILGYLHMILYEGFGKVDKAAKEYLQKVYLKADLLAKLVRDLLNVSRIEQGRLKIEIKATDLQAILKDLCEDHALAAKEKGITLTFREPKPSLPKVMADSDKLKEIIQNLLSNAVKFTKQGGVVVWAGQKEGMVEVGIKDTGIGIPKDAQKHIFEKFYRVDNSWVREAGGTGLGLHLVKQYLKLMHGKIWFESAGENKGTTFCFTLPVAK